MPSSKFEANLTLRLGVRRSSFSISIFLLTGWFLITVTYSLQAIDYIFIRTNSEHLVSSLLHSQGLYPEVCVCMVVFPCGAFRRFERMMMGRALFRTVVFSCVALELGL